MASRDRPTHRDDFFIAIICALPREADAVSLLFDRFWDEDGDPFGRASGDTNTYMTGQIDTHNVVLAVLPNMGTTSAAAAAANLRSSYGNIKLTFIVGICGAVPTIAGSEAFLGDVVISKAIIQYDYGRQYQNNFCVKSIVEDSLGRANRDLRGLLASFETELGRERLKTKATENLERLQSHALRKRRRANYRYPGLAKDQLYKPDYSHAHRNDCGHCSKVPTEFCLSASTNACAAIGCDEANLIVRERHTPDGKYTPELFIGRLASGNSVMKSGQDRDRIAANYGIIAFEMEGAGAWDEMPCLIIKGICDYADSHKNKDWQDFAAATAASVTRAVIERYVLDDGLRVPVRGSRPGAKGPFRSRDQDEKGGRHGLGVRNVSDNTFGNNARINQGDVFGNMSM